jgi:hypothetical protein
MSTLQTTDRNPQSLQISLNIALATIGMLVAIAVAAVILATGSTSHVTQPAPVTTNANTSAAYAPPHYDGTTSQTSTPSPVKVTANHQNSAAYTKAGLYHAAR